MFGFLNPFLLFLLPLASIPLLIHFFNRRRSEKILFPSLVFLKGLEKTRLRKIQLKQWLLLAIRTLIVLLSIFAFARPVWRPEGAGGSGRTSAVLVLDDGYRSGELTKDGVLGERYKAAGEEVFELLKEGDEALTLSATRTETGDALRHDWMVEEEKLVKMVTTAAASSVSAALEKARKLLSSSRNPNREIYLFSDGCFELNSPSVASPAAGKLFWFKPDLEESDNRVLVSYRLADPVLAPGLPVRVEAEVLNLKQADAAGVLVSLFLDGKKVSQKALDLTSGESKKVLLEGTVFSPGWHGGYVELPDDDLLADNRIYFAFYIRPKLRLLLASDAAGYWDAAELVLNVKGTSGSWFEIQKARLSDFARLDWSKLDAALVALPENFDFSWWERLLRFAGEGRGVLLAPEGRLIGYPTNLLAEAFGILPESLSTAGAGTFHTFRPEAAHPIFSFLAETKNPPTLKFHSYFRAKTGPEAVVAARFAGGGAALMEKKGARGRLLFSTASLEQGNTDLYFHAFAVPFFFRMAQYLASSSSAPADFKAGARVFFSPPVFPKKFPLNLAAPDGSVTEIGLSGKREGFLDLGVLSQAGLYRLLEDSALVGQVAVNIDPRASALPVVSTAQMEKALPGFEVIEIPLGEKIAPIVRQSRTGKEIWKILAFLCLGLLAAEMVVVRWGEKPVAAPPA